MLTVLPKKFSDVCFLTLLLKVTTVHSRYRDMQGNSLTVGGAIGIVLGFLALGIIVVLVICCSRKDCRNRCLKIKAKITRTKKAKNDSCIQDSENPEAVFVPSISDHTSDPMYCPPTYSTPVTIPLYCQPTYSTPVTIPPYCPPTYSTPVTMPSQMT